MKQLQIKDKMTIQAKIKQTKNCAKSDGMAQLKAPFGATYLGRALREYAHHKCRCDKIGISGTN